MALDQVVEHVGVAPVADSVEPDTLRVRDNHPEFVSVCGEGNPRGPGK